MTKEELVKYIGSLFEGKLTLYEEGRVGPWFTFESGSILKVMAKLRDDESLKFDFLCNISGVDTGERFEIVYSLASIVHKHRMDLRTELPYDKAEIESIKEIWAGANWHEREAWELYGIDFKNHGNLTRFLLPDEWDQGHPMLKNWDAPDFIRMPEV